MDSKRNNILSVAEKLFAYYGIKKTTMDEIAHNARMGKSTLYHYFESKEKIFAEVIQRDSRMFKMKLDEALLGTSSPQEKIHKYIIVRMKHLKELVNFYTTLRDEYLENYLFVENIRKDFAAYELKTLASILKDGINKKVFSMKNINNTARMISYALKGLEDALFIRQEIEDIEKDSILMMEFVLKGIEEK